MFFVSWKAHNKCAKKSPAHKRGFSHFLHLLMSASISFSRRLPDVNNATPVCSHHCCSSGVSSMSLRPCHRRPCNSALAASTTAGGLQGGCHGVSCITRSSATLSEPASSRLRPTRSPPTSFLIITAATCAAVPTHNRRSTLLSSRCITSMDIQSSSSLFSVNA